MYREIPGAGSTDPLAESIAGACPRVRVPAYVPPQPRRPVHAPAKPAETQGSNFPAGPAWEITESHAWHWFLHRFADLMQNEGFLQRAPLDGHELLLLVYDLGCYEHLCLRWMRAPERYPRPPALSDYLAAGREHWGSIGVLAREWMAEIEGT